MENYYDGRSQTSSQNIVYRQDSDTGTFRKQFFPLLEANLDLLHEKYQVDNPHLVKLKHDFEKFEIKLGRLLLSNSYNHNHNHNHTHNQSSIGIGIGIGIGISISMREEIGKRTDIILNTNTTEPASHAAANSFPDPQYTRSTYADIDDQDVQRTEQMSSLEDSRGLPPLPN
jgi:hypothetical protein